MEISFCCDHNSWIVDVIESVPEKKRAVGPCFFLMRVIWSGGQRTGNTPCSGGSTGRTIFVSSCGCLVSARLCFCLSLTRSRKVLWCLAIDLYTSRGTESLDCSVLWRSATEWKKETDTYYCTALSQLKPNKLRLAGLWRTVSYSHWHRGPTCR